PGLPSSATLGQTHEHRIDRMHAFFHARIEALLLDPSGEPQARARLGVGPARGVDRGLEHLRPRPPPGGRPNPLALPLARRAGGSTSGTTVEGHATATGSAHRAVAAASTGSRPPDHRATPSTAMLMIPTAIPLQRAARRRRGVRRRLDHGPRGGVITTISLE